MRALGHAEAVRVFSLIKAFAAYKTRLLAAVAAHAPAGGARWVLLGIAVVHAIGIGWGLPASDGWDNDGIAPRDVLPGLAATFTPGRYYTYPPLQLALIGTLTLPITIVGALKAPSFALPDLVGELIGVPYMTAIAFVARFVSLIMSLGVAHFVGRIAEQLSGSRRAGLFAMATAGLDAALTYYGHTSNLDVPYLFWATGSLFYFTRALDRTAPRPDLLRRAFLLAALAIATKDQAYALFALSIPLVLGAWLYRQRRHVREVAVAAARALLVLLVLDGAVFNPTGFFARLAFLSGPASHDYVEYTGDWSGYSELLADAARRCPNQLPPIFCLVLVGGAIWTIARAKDRLLAALPLFAALSFTLAFNFTARRTDARFLLPQALMLAVYGGIALDALARHVAGRVAAAALLAYALFHCAVVDLGLLLDPRYDAEAWLAQHASGASIETYGLNVYLPRFPKDAHVRRVGPEPLVQRNPLPGVEEVQASFDRAAGAEGAPRFIVVSEAWAWRYRIKADDWFLGVGRTHAPTQTRSAADEAATRWFESLASGRGPYVLAHESPYRLDALPWIDIHGTMNRPVRIYERR